MAPLRIRLVKALLALPLVGVGMVALSGTAGAQASCTGNNVIEQAPYSCTETRDITGITFTVTLNIDATGRAVVDFVMSPVQQADVPIAIHSYTNISSDPRQFVNGVIPAGATTAQLVVPRIECGQFDIKAVDTTPGAAAGRIAGPVVTWGEVCQTPATTTTSATTSISPSSVSPTSRVAPATIPSTGGGGVVPWTWSLPILALAAILILVSRRRPAS